MEHSPLTTTTAKNTLDRNPCRTVPLRQRQQRPVAAPALVRAHDHPAGDADARQLHHRVRPTHPHRPPQTGLRAGARAAASSTRTTGARIRRPAHRRRIDHLGDTPSLTITAQAERAMSYWPNHGDADRRIDPVPPRNPTVPADAPSPTTAARPDASRAARNSRTVGERQWWRGGGSGFVRETGIEPPPAQPSGEDSGRSTSQFFPAQPSPQQQNSLRRTEKVEISAECLNHGR